jgi:transposase-like protein
MCRTRYKKVHGVLPDKPAESDASKDPSKRVRDDYNKRRWSDEEHGRLVKLVAQHGAGDWATKAAALGTGRTASSVYNRYRTTIRKRNAEEQLSPDADAAGAQAAASDQAMPQPTPGTAESAGTGTGGPEPDSGSSSSQGSSARPRKRGR